MKTKMVQVMQKVERSESRDWEVLSLEDGEH